MIRNIARLGSTHARGGVLRLTRSKVATEAPAFVNGARGLLTRAECVGPTEPPLLIETCHDHLTKIVNKFGDRTAVVSSHQNVRITYFELQEKSTQLANGLRKAGVKKGDRVVFSLGNNVEFAIAHYAVFKLGAVVVPLNPAYNARQIVAALNHLDATHYILSLETNLPYKPPKSAIPLLQSILVDIHGNKFHSEEVPTLKEVIILDNSSGRLDVSNSKLLRKFNDVMEDGGSGKFVPEETAPDDLNMIQFTSGTTSMPKAACLTHINLLNNGMQIGDRMGITEKDVVVCPPPLFHCFGSVLGYLTCMTHGTAIVFPSEAFDPKKSLLSAQQEKATCLYGVPTMYLAELELLHTGEVEHKGFENLHGGIAAGSVVPSEIMSKLHKTLNLTDLTICYGMTETSPVSFMTFPDDPTERKTSTVGRIMPHLRAKIVDVHDRSKIVGIGKKGEIAISGYSLQKYYWEDPEKTAEVMTTEDGVRWMYTGDEAQMDAEGYVKITGRIKDLIIRGGENISPLEVENILFAHPAILEVSVVGLPDERLGECVAAFVSCHEHGEFKAISEEEIKQWVLEKSSHHLIPKHIFWIKDLEGGLPKTASGKIQKYKLVEEGKKMLAAQAALKV